MLVARPHFREKLIQILRGASVSHQHFVFRAGQDHKGSSRIPKSIIDIVALVGEQRKRNSEIVPVDLNLLVFVSACNADYFDVVLQTGVLLDHVVEPINYRRGLLAHGSECVKDIDENELARYL